MKDSIRTAALAGATLRVFAAVVAILFGAYAFVRLTALLDDPARWGSHMPAVLVSGLAAVVGLMLAASSALSKRVDSFLWGVMGVLAGGAVGFIGGFVGPMVFTPDDNLGPMLGFLTGPVGALVGGISTASLARAMKCGDAEPRV